MDYNYTIYSLNVKTQKTNLIATFGGAFNNGYHEMLDALKHITFDNTDIKNNYIFYVVKTCIQDSTINELVLFAKYNELTESVAVF